MPKAWHQVIIFTLQASTLYLRVRGPTLVVYIALCPTLSPNIQDGRIPLLQDAARTGDGLEPETLGSTFRLFVAGATTEPEFWKTSSFPLVPSSFRCPQLKNQYWRVPAYSYDTSLVQQALYQSE